MAEQWFVEITISKDGAHWWARCPQMPAMNLCCTCQATLIGKAVKEVNAAYAGRRGDFRIDAPFAEPEEAQDEPAFP